MASGRGRHHVRWSFLGAFEEYSTRGRRSGSLYAERRERVIRYVCVWCGNSDHDDNNGTIASIFNTVAAAAYYVQESW